MAKTRVCHIITKLELGGAQQNTLYTVRHLDRDRFDLSLICGSGGILDDDARALEKTHTAFIPALIREISPLRDIRAFFQIRRQLKNISPDIVHTHSSKAGILGRWAAWSAGVPVIIHTFHGFGFNDFQHPLKHILFLFSEKITSLITTTFIVVSQENLTVAIRHNLGSRERYVLIRSGVKLSDYSPNQQRRETVRSTLGIQPEMPLITTIGAFKPQKNLHDFIEAARLIIETHPSARFIIIGDGKLRSALEHDIERKGLSSHISLLGWRTDIADLLAASDLFAMTSLWEGLPRAVVEAMATGLPIVANAIDGVKEVVKDGETGFLVPPKAPAITAKHITSILDDPALWQRFSDAARSAIGPEFDIDVMVRQQEDLYARLTAGNSV